MVSLSQKGAARLGCLCVLGSAMGFYAVSVKEPVLVCVAGCVSVLCVFCELCVSTSWSSSSALLMAGLAKGSRTEHIRLAWARTPGLQVHQIHLPWDMKEEPMRSWTVLDSDMP